MITAFGTSTNIPSGFLPCDGVTSYSGVTYSKLYALIGKTYGTDGGTTFKTPNMSAATLVSPGVYLTYIIKT
jgi:microcystin-dependent protein